MLFLKPSPALLYVVRTLLAMALALYIAFALQLSSPGSSVITVMIIANPTPGAVISKAIWRLCGTAVGAVASVVLLACFSQSSLLFLAAFSIWIGVCVFMSVMFRYFRSYAAILSAYTVSIIALPALVDPQNVMLLALSRLAVVVIGVISLAAVTMIFQPNFTARSLLARANAVLAGTCRLIVQAPDPAQTPAYRTEQKRLASEMERLDEAIEFAGIENVSLSFHAPSLRRGFAALYAALIGGTKAIASINSSFHPSPAPALSSSVPAGSFLLEAASATQLAALAHVKQEISSCLETLSDERAFEEIGIDRILSSVDATLNETMRIQDSMTNLELLTEITVLNRPLEHIRDCVAALAAYQARRPPAHGRLRLRSFKEYNIALTNSIRAVLACLICGLFWYSSAWPDGDFALLLLSVVCTLIASTPNPSAASLEFCKAILPSVAVDFVCFVLLPHETGYIGLMLVMLPFFAIAVYGTTKPKYGLRSLGFFLFFVTDLNIANQMNYDFPAFLNLAMALAIGVAGGALTYRVILPLNPTLGAVRLIGGLRRITQRFAKGARRWYPNDPLGWQVLANQRIQRLLLRLQSRAAEHQVVLENGGGLMIVAEEILQLRGILEHLSLPPAVSAATLSAIQSLSKLDQPAAAAEAAIGAEAALKSYHQTHSDSGTGVLRAAARFRLIAIALLEAQKMLVLEHTLAAGI